MSCCLNMANFADSLLFADARGGLQAIDYGIVLVYLAGVVGAGFYFSREQRESDDYFVAGMFFRHVGQRAIVPSVICGLIIAVSCAWWTELVWFLGLTDYQSLEQAKEHVPGPSPFLVTPLAATSTLLIAVLLGVLIPSRNPDRAKLFSWRTIVFGGRKT